MFWVDETVQEITGRNGKKYLATDYKTPSGNIHVGALRGVLIHDVITRGLIDRKHQAEFWYGFDDLDPMDGLAAELKEDFGKYMGQPLCNIPSPDPQKNFAHFFADPFIKTMKDLDVGAKIIWASEIYRSGQYDKAIEIILNNAPMIRKIYEEVSGAQKPQDWYPLNVICPQCGKIGTTHVYDWDGKEVSFTCEPDMVEWAKGCGYKGKTSPFKGNAKMPYKPETAAKWFSFGTAVELAGKDHYTKGGSFYIAQAIAKQVFNIAPAYGYGYEWFLVGGKKMSTSKGTGATIEQIAQILPSELLRFLMVRTRAKRTIEFNPEGDTIPLLYDEYDRCALAYQEDPKSDLGRAYYYSELNISKAQPKYLLRFSKIASLVQMPHIDILSYAQKEKGSPLTDSEKLALKQRQQIAQKWLASYAPENVKFSVQENLPGSVQNLSELQKKYLHEVAIQLGKIDKWDGKEVHAILHEVKNGQEISPKDAFSAIYRIFIDKDSGPQAGWFLAALDKQFVITRLKEIGEKQ